MQEALLRHKGASEVPGLRFRLRPSAYIARRDSAARRSGDGGGAAGFEGGARRFNSFGGISPPLPIVEAVAVARSD